LSILYSQKQTVDQVDQTETIYQLVKQWCRAVVPAHANEALQQIAILAGGSSNVSEQLSDQDSQWVLQWLKEHHPNAYLWTMSQRSIGHPAMVWGTVNRTNKPIKPQN
jgi:hypothetical protein